MSARPDPVHYILELSTAVSVCSQLCPERVTIIYIVVIVYSLSMSTVVELSRDNECNQDNKCSVDNKFYQDEDLAKQQECPGNKVHRPSEDKRSECLTSCDGTKSNWKSERG